VGRGQVKELWKNVGPGCRGLGDMSGSRRRIKPQGWAGWLGAGFRRPMTGSANRRGVVCWIARSKVCELCKGDAATLRGCGQARLSLLSQFSNEHRCLLVGLATNEAIGTISITTPNFFSCSCIRHRLCCALEDKLGYWIVALLTIVDASSECVHISSFLEIGLIASYRQVVVPCGRYGRGAGSYFGGDVGLLGGKRRVGGAAMLDMR
jgi:hypothetical protein